MCVGQLSRNALQEDSADDTSATKTPVIRLISVHRPRPPAPSTAAMPEVPWPGSHAPPQLLRLPAGLALHGMRAPMTPAAQRAQTAEADERPRDKVCRSV
jgi:hypothetical protein